MSMQRAYNHIEMSVFVQVALSAANQEARQAFQVEETILSVCPANCASTCGKIRSEVLQSLCSVEERYSISRGAAMAPEQNNLI